MWFRSVRGEDVIIDLLLEGGVCYGNREAVYVYVGGRRR